MAPQPPTIKVPLPEQIIAGKYRILQRIGSGGMGLVFLAEQLADQRKVALKFLDPEPNEDESRVVRFLREAKVGLEVQHPGAAQVLDLGRDEALRLYLAFELVEGEDLREVLKREGRLHYREARDVVLQVADVLAFAHSRGIVHRDVKPENLRLRRELQRVVVKVLDFGIARLVRDSGMRLTAEGMLAGTPRYMSPEQVKDEALDGRTDQYALGLVFFEALTGAVAIGGKNVSQILLHQMQTPVPPLSFVDPLLDFPQVDAFIARACAKEPRDRFATMAEFSEALRAVMVDEVRWPMPRVPTEDGQAAIPTRDGKKASAPVPGEGYSDTYIRTPDLTAADRRQDVATEPDRAAVRRREDGPIPQGSPAAPALTPPGAPPFVSSGSRPGVQPALVRPSNPAPQGLEFPTEPERPAIPRERPVVAQTVLGGVPAPRKPPRSKVPWVLIISTLVLINLAVWWFLIRER